MVAVTDMPPFTISDAVWADICARADISPHWSEQALCTQTDPEAFFPEQGCSVRAAKQVCQACPVRAECLEWALTHNEDNGVWGGASRRERQEIKRRRRNAA